MRERTHQWDRARRQYAQLVPWGIAVDKLCVLLSTWWILFSFFSLFQFKSFLLSCTITTPTNTHFFKNRLPKPLGFDHSQYLHMYVDFIILFFLSQISSSFVPKNILHNKKSILLREPVKKFCWRENFFKMSKNMHKKKLYQINEVSRQKVCLTKAQRMKVYRKNTVWTKALRTRAHQTNHVREKARQIKRVLYRIQTQRVNAHSMKVYGVFINKLYFIRNWKFH